MSSNKEYIRYRILNELRNGAIVLLHSCLERDTNHVRYSIDILAGN